MYSTLREQLQERYGDDRYLYLRALYLNVEVGPKTPDVVVGWSAVDNYASGDITYQQAMTEISEGRQREYDLDQYNQDWQEFLDLCEQRIQEIHKRTTMVYSIR